MKGSEVRLLLQDFSRQETQQKGDGFIVQPLQGEEGFCQQPCVTGKGLSLRKVCGPGHEGLDLGCPTRERWHWNKIVTLQSATQ